jgi:hypothetical protein
MANLHQWSRRASDEALTLFYEAIELDPRFAKTYVVAAYCHGGRLMTGYVAARSNGARSGQHLWAGAWTKRAPRWQSRARSDAPRFGDRESRAVSATRGFRQICRGPATGWTAGVIDSGRDESARQ